MNIINLTPHEITLLDRDNNIIATIPPSELIKELPQRVPENLVTVRTIDINGYAFPILTSNPNDSEIKSFILAYERVCPQRWDTVYVVSNIIKQVMKHRNDFVTPITVRVNGSNILGCNAFRT